MSDITPDKEATPTEERWIYAGIRELNDKRSHCWITDEAGTRRYWGSLKGSFVVGGYYTAKVTRENGQVILHGAPDYTGSYVPDRDMRSILWAEEHAAKSKLSARALERRHAKESPVDDALRPLMRLAAKLQVGTEQDAFVVYVERQLRRAMYLPEEKW